MKVIHVVKTLSPGYGGPARSVLGLVRALQSSGVDSSLVTLEHCETTGLEDVRHIFNLSGSIHDYRKLVSGIIENVAPDIIHTHDLWMPKLHICNSIARSNGIPYVVAPRGAMEPWSLRQKWLKKKIARLLYQDKDIRLASALHVTAKSEARQLRRLGFTNKLIESPNGVNLPNADVLGKLFDETSRGKKRVLFMSRMHPKKGVLELVDAWSRLKQIHDLKAIDNWCCELVYTVTGAIERSYEKLVRQRVAEYGLEEVFIFTGPLSDSEKWGAYARSDVFVLPTYSENFGIVVAEALFAGVPVITTKGAPWAVLNECKCGWWIDIDLKSLVAAMKEALEASDDERKEMGLRGRNVILQNYTWDAVVTSMIRGYEEILSGGDNSKHQQRR
ncbi:MAG: glycosyltransferase [Kiritimatiellae bacterium]|nr:glycosyltransferase [Kiritimatiellia bacterium]